MSSTLIIFIEDNHDLYEALKAQQRVKADTLEIPRCISNTQHGKISAQEEEEEEQQVFEDTLRINRTDYRTISCSTRARGFSASPSLFRVR